MDVTNCFMIGFNVHTPWEGGYIRYCKSSKKFMAKDALVGKLKLLLCFVKWIMSLSNDPLGNYGYAYRLVMQ